ERLIFAEAGLTKMQMNSSVFIFLQCPDDRSVLSAADPGIGQTVRLVHFQHFAMDDAVPITIRLLTELKTMADDRFEIVVHDPLGQCIRIGKGGPYFFYGTV